MVRLLHSATLLTTLLAAARSSQEPVPLASALAAEDACAATEGASGEECELSLRQLRGERKQADALANKAQQHAQESTDAAAGRVLGKFSLTKRYDFSGDPHEDFDVVVITDKDMTHSCSNYTDDGTTVLTRDDKLVLKVASECEGGICLNSGRVMSKRSYQYGIFTFSARVPKCNHIWPALWLLPGDTGGHGTYGPWPCSGEIDILETVNEDSWGAFNIVGGYGTNKWGCGPDVEVECNQCAPPGYCTSTTFTPGNASWYEVEKADCSATHPSWKEHTFVLSWQPGLIMTWVDPVFTWDADGSLIKVEPSVRDEAANGLPSFKAFEQDQTPTWQAVEPYMKKCFEGKAGSDAPFDLGMKIVMNIAVGGYGGAPCVFGAPTCGSVCGAAIGSELVISDLSVWQQA